MAPYWSDNDIRREGEVSYEIVEKGRSSYDDMLLDRVNAYLAANTMANFSGTFMILAEWRDVHPYPHGSDYISYFLSYYPAIRSFTNQVYTTDNDITLYCFYDCNYYINFIFVKLVKF